MSENEKRTGKGKPVPNSAGTRFKAGQSGNPGGRPRKKPVTERYEKDLEGELPEKDRKLLGLEKGATRGDGLARAQVNKAVKGDTVAAKEIADRIEGRARQSVEHAGEGGGPVKIEYTSYLGAPPSPIKPKETHELPESNS